LFAGLFIPYLIVQIHIAVDHVVHGKGLLHTIPAIESRHLLKLFDGMAGPLNVIYQKAAMSVLNYFRHAAAVVGNDRGAAGQGFNHRQAKGFVEMDRVQQSKRVAQQFISLGWADTADVFNTASFQEWLYVSFKIILVLNNTCNHQFFIAGPGNFNGVAGALVRVNASEEQEIIARVRVKSKLFKIDTMAHGTDVVKRGSSVSIAD